MKLMPLSSASCVIRVVCSCPRLPMFILPPNCIVPSATSLTMSPVFPSLLYFIFHAPSPSRGRRLLLCRSWAGKFVVVGQGLQESDQIVLFCVGQLKISELSLVEIGWIFGWRPACDLF